MPYSLKKSPQCPAGKPWAVLGANGKPVPGGCHATKAEALKHLAALNANVPDAQGEKKGWRL